jgi:phosphatidylglycerophosphate synthase
VPPPSRTISTVTWHGLRTGVQPGQGDGSGSGQTAGLLFLDHAGTSLGWIPAWAACIIIGRELAVTGLRNIIAQNEMDVSASMAGKYKTGFQIAAIIPLMFHYPVFGIDFHAIGMFFLWGALVFTLWSGAFRGLFPAV